MKKLLLIPLLLLVSCTKQKVSDNKDMLDYVSLCAITKFSLDYADREIILTYTQEINAYYLTDLYYRIEFENEVYKTEYISALNSNNELVMKEVIL